MIRAPATTCVKHDDPRATEDSMTLELSVEDAALVLDFVQGRLVELKKEINRTENIAFRDELRKIQRALEHLLDQLAR
jgi:hypothetical protein